MTPKEKAIELVEGIASCWHETQLPFDLNRLSDEDSNSAKQSAIIAVNEIIRSLNMGNGITASFLREVKREIKKL